MYFLFSAADVWRSPVFQDGFYWGMEREDSDKTRSFSCTKCIGMVCISFFFLFFQSYCDFYLTFTNFVKSCLVLIAESWQVVSCMRSSHQLLQEKMNISKLAFLDKSVTLLESGGVITFSLD